MTMILQVNGVNPTTLQHNNSTREAKRVAKKYLNNTETRHDIKALSSDISDRKIDRKTSQELFFAAAKKGDTELIVALIDAGIEINAIDATDRTALMYVIETNNLPLAKILLANLAEPNIKNKKLNTAIMLAAICDSTGEMLDLLNLYGANINDTNFEGTSALMFAISNQNYTTIRKLIFLGADVEEKDYEGTSILMVAIEQNLDITIITLILDNLKNANAINAQDLLEETALMKCEDYNIALALLERGASLDQENLEEKTALLIAAKYGRDHLIDLFMTYGADIRHLDNKGWTALMLAANESNALTLRKLLKYCCYTLINYYNKQNLTALKIAAFHKNLALVYELLVNGAYFDQRTDHSKLLNLIYFGRIEIAIEERDENIQVIFQELEGSFKYYLMVY